MNFEQYLIEKGYVKNVYDYKLTGLRKAKKHEILSTVTNLDFRYTKDGEKMITWGLNLDGKSATLIYPRPKGITWFHDDEMNRMLLDKTPEEIYKLIK